MKKNIILYTLLTSLFFIGCKKDDGFLPASITLDRVPLISITKDAAAVNDVIVPSSVGTFSGKINITPLYASDKLPEKVDLVVIRNGNRANVKVLKAGLTVPTVATFTGTELAALFGGIATCDAFQVGTDIYFNGKKYEAFPPGGVGNGGATDPNQPGYSVELTYNTKVQYDPNIYQGNFVVVKDNWQDTKPGDIIVFTKIDATHFSFKYPTAVNALPIIVTVDPATLIPSITKQVIGTAWTYDPAPPPPTAATSGTSSILAPCAGTISLNMTWTEGTGTYANLTFSLKKQ